MLNALPVAMLPTVPLAMFGWIPFVFFLFQKMEPRRAAVAAFFLAWMFLPNYSYGFPGMPDYDKVLAASAGVLLATMIFAPRYFSEFKFSAQDAIIILWCLSPALASVTNGLGLYDGFSASKNYFTAWAVPYFVGRLFFKSPTDLKDLVIGMFYGGLIYAPLCVVEILLSPQLHNWFYGWHPHDFLQSIRGSTYRPVIFMKHGLMVGMWMACAVLAGTQLFRNGMLKQTVSRIPVPAVLILFCLFLVFTACKSMGATLLTLAGIGVMVVAQKMKTALPFLLLAAAPLLFVGLRSTGAWDGQNLIDLAYQASEDRGASLEFRIMNEDLLLVKARERMVFGWGGWGRSRVYNEKGEDVSVTDGYWIILYGTTGLVGLTAFFMILIIPALRFTFAFKKEHWKQPEMLVLLSLPLILILYAIDSLANDMKMPVYMLTAGGLITTLQHGFMLTQENSDTKNLEADLSQSLPRYL